MMRIQLFDDAGQVIQLSPDDLLLHVGLEGLHLVTEKPDEKPGMILVFQHGFTELGALFLDTGGVRVIETVAHMFNPETGGDGKAQFVGPIEQRFSVHELFQVLDSPGSNRISAGKGKYVKTRTSERVSAGGPRALDEIRLAIPRQRESAVWLLHDLHPGAGRRVLLARYANRTCTEHERDDKTDGCAAHRLI